MSDQRLRILTSTAGLIPRALECGHREQRRGGLGAAGIVAGPVLAVLSSG